MRKFSASVLKFMRSHSDLAFFVFVNTGCMCHGEICEDSLWKYCFMPKKLTQLSVRDGSPATLIGSLRMQQGSWFHPVLLCVTLLESKMLL